MATLYVSKAAGNGYPVGNDSNSGLTQALAKLTIAGAHTAASSGDTIIVNDGNYAEVLAITKGVTINPVTDYGVTISGTGTPTDIITTSMSGGVTVTFGKIIIDAQTIGATGAAVNCGSSSKVHNVTFNGTRIYLGSGGNGAYGIRDQITTGDVTFNSAQFYKTSGTNTANAINSVLARLAGSLTITSCTFNLAYNSSTANIHALWAIPDSTTGNGSTMTVTVTNNTLVQTNSNGTVGGNYYGFRVNNATTFTVTGNSIDIDHTGSGSINPLEISCYDNDPTYEAKTMTGTCNNNYVINRGTAGYCIAVGSDGFNGNTVDKINSIDVHSNTIECTSRATTTHGIIYGANTGGWIRSNTVINVPLGMIFKNQVGGVMCGNVVYNSLVTGGQYASLRLKGSLNTRVVNNTVVNPVTVTYVGGLGVFYAENDTYAITSITSVTTTATVTTASAHNLVTGNTVNISGAVETEYNGAYSVTVTGASTFTYTFAGSATSPATGTKVWSAGDAGRTGNTKDAVVENNLIIDMNTTAGRPVRTGDASQTATFTKNNYWHPAANPSYIYGGNTRTSFSTWQSNEEATATNVNPRLSPAYKLPEDSTLIGTGNITTHVNGGRSIDYTGNAFRTPPSVGAYEYAYTSPTIQDRLNNEAGTVGLSVQKVLENLGGRPQVGIQIAANDIAGTANKITQEALNNEVGTNGLSIQEALRRL